MFADIGNAWFSSDEAIDGEYIGLYPVSINFMGRKYNIYADVGFGLRFNVFYIPLRLDCAFPIDYSGLHKQKFNISFGWDF